MADFEELRVRRKEGERWRRGQDMSAGGAAPSPGWEGGKERARPDFPGVGGVCWGRPSLSVPRFPFPPRGLCCCRRRGGSCCSFRHFKSHLGGAERAQGSNDSCWALRSVRLKGGRWITTGLLKMLIVVESLEIHGPLSNRESCACPA